MNYVEFKCKMIRKSIIMHAACASYEFKYFRVLLLGIPPNSRNKKIKRTKKYEFNRKMQTRKENQRNEEKIQNNNSNSNNITRLEYI